MNGLRVHFIGAKGTGMTALAEIFASRGAVLSGSDVPDVFYTDAILKEIGMQVSESFDVRHVAGGINLVVYSDAYKRDENPELLEAARLGIPCASFAEALGSVSAEFDSSGIAGVHGKTTTTAMAGCIADALGLPATVLAGSAVANFGGRCTLVRGSRYLVAETDEYRRHFLHFHPKRILLTSIESDHQDYYPTLESIEQAYMEYVESLPGGGALVYCADDPGAARLAHEISTRRRDLKYLPYGFSAEGSWRIETLVQTEGAQRFRLEGAPGEWTLSVPGRHLVLDSVGALALSSLLWESETSAPFDWDAARRALAGFRGSRRRSEILGEEAGVLFMDDYAHHPTAVRTTLEGIKAFWPSRRLVVDFMSHTYSRTKALMEEFAASLDPADSIVLHDIYASAREAFDPSVRGEDLFERVAARRPELARDPQPVGSSVSRQPFILYAKRPLDDPEKVESLLGPGDLFLTMGAGDNWKLGRKIMESLKSGKRKG